MTGALKLMAANSLQEMARWASGLSLDQVPVSVREHAKNQVLSMLAAVHSGYSSETGQKLLRAFPSPGEGAGRALPAGNRMPPSHAAFLMAAWSMVLDFDDVMLGGHTGHSSVLVPLGFAEALAASGADLLLAQIVANEIAARINMAVALGAIRGQMASHLHLVGAAAARAKLEGLDAHAMADALGFALSYPARALYPAFLGSDAKALCAAWPLRMGLESVDAVRAGLRGNSRVLDDPRGFINTFAQVPMPEFLGGLGERWHTETNSFKLYPGCGYIDGIIDAVLFLVRRYALTAEQVESVDVYASLFAVGMAAHSAPYLRGAESLVSTLTFSIAYNVACAIIYHDLGPEHLTRAKIQDEQAWQLARRVKVHHDAYLSIGALKADIPVGAALRRAGRLQAFRFALGLGHKALGGGLGPRSLATKLLVACALAGAAGKRGPLDFTRSEKRIGARVEIRTSDGRRLSKQVDIPAGFAGSGDWRSMRGLLREKLIKCASPNVAREAADEAADLVERLDDLKADGVRRLIDLNCRKRKEAFSSSLMV